MASHAAISAICCLNWNHKWAIYVMFAGKVHVPFYGFGSTKQCRPPAVYASLSCGSTPARPQLLTSVFLGLPCFLVQGIRKFVINLIQLGHSPQYHLSHQLRRTIYWMPSFCSSEAEGVPSLSSVLQTQRITVWSLLWSHCSSRFWGARRCPDEIISLLVQHQPVQTWPSSSPMACTRLRLENPPGG